MATRYIHFREDQKEQARRTDIASILRSQGETLKRSGSEYEWRDGSQKVTIRGNLWYHQYEQTGGDTIDFVRRYYNKSYPEAVEYLLSGCGRTLAVSPPVIKERKPFVLPKQNDNMRRVYAYLINRRGIDSKVLNAFTVKGMIYESADYHNVVFVGFDSSGMPVHAHKRGTGLESSYKGNTDGSDPRNSFHWHGKSGKLYLFEAPIDMLSFISIQKIKDVNTVWARESELRNSGIFECELSAAACRWQRHSYAASCGVSDHVMWQMMKDNPNLKEVRLCRDNDEAGHQANKRTSDALILKCVPYEILVPVHKDWNEDLLHPQTETEEEVCDITM